MVKNDEKHEMKGIAEVDQLKEALEIQTKIINLLMKKKVKSEEKREMKGIVEDSFNRSSFTIVMRNVK